MRLQDISDELRKIGFGVLVTRSQAGILSGSPIKHDSRAQYTGTSYFFTTEGSSTAQDLTQDQNALLSYQTQTGTGGTAALFITIEGKAELISDETLFSEQWTEGLDSWFTNGLATPGLLLIKVVAHRLRYWSGGRSGDVSLGEV